MVGTSGPYDSGGSATATELSVTVPYLETPLLLYVAASDHEVSGVLVQEKEQGCETV
jgi:hypothetical protein